MCKDGCSCCTKQVKQTTINKVYDFPQEGQKGDDGLTPYIGVNGNWWIGAVDTGLQANGDTYVPDFSDDVFTI